MIESKIELTERLRREGRWAEASRFKDTAMADFRAKGMKRNEAAEAAWTAMAGAYPPLPVVESPADPAASPPEATTTDAPPIPRSDQRTGSGRNWTKKPWGALPESTDQRADANWALANLAVCVKTFQDKPTVIEWARALSPPPSSWAEAMLEAAALNRQKFLFDLVPAAMKSKAESETDAERDKGERKSIAEIERVLNQMLEGMDEELRADVSIALQKRVRDMLSNWGQQCGVSFAADALARLDSAIIGLIQDGLRAFAPSSGGVWRRE